MSNFSTTYLNESKAIIDAISIEKVELIARELAEIRSQMGRLFFLGVGGSAANCSHAGPCWRNREIQ